MAVDVAKRINAGNVVRNGAAGAFAPGEVYISKLIPIGETQPDITDASVAAMVPIGRHRLYYTTGAVDPADGT